MKQVLPISCDDRGGRANLEAEHVIDLAVQLQSRHGKAAAARFLTAYGASFNLTVRVLTEPARRRRQPDGSNGATDLNRRL